MTVIKMFEKNCLWYVKHIILYKINIEVQVYLTSDIDFFWTVILNDSFRTY